MSGPGSSSGDEERSGPRAARLAVLARRLVVDLPPLDAPLVVFQPDGRGGEAEPVFLAGDLHAVHPRVADGAVPRPRDRSLDNAIVALADHEHEALDLAAIEGLWGTRIEPGRTGAVPYLSVTDSLGRIRAWRLLPPPRLIIGIGHVWLAAIAPPDDPRAGPGPSQDPASR